jgi:hypothetical protein
MKLATVTLILVSAVTVAGCTGTHHVGIASTHGSKPATVHGQVWLEGGPTPSPGQVSALKGSGSVLVFANAHRTGTPILKTVIHSDGSYSFLTQPGHYYLATTAATFNGVPADGPSITVNAGQDLRADFGVPIK